MFALPADALMCAMKSSIPTTVRICLNVFAVGIVVPGLSTAELPVGTIPDLLKVSVYVIASSASFTTFQSNMDQWLVPAVDAV